MGRGDSRTILPHEQSILNAATRVSSWLDAYQNGFVNDMLRYGDKAYVSDKQEKVIADIKDTLDTHVRYFMFNYSVAGHIHLGLIKGIGYPGHPSNQDFRVKAGHDLGINPDAVIVTGINEFKCEDDFYAFAKVM